MRLLPLQISDEERSELERRVRSNTIEARAAQRARIILLAADGVSNRKIAELVGMHFNQVGIWRQRFEVDRLAGLLDGDRPGRPSTYGHDDVLLLVKTVTEDPPDGATRWTMDALAARMAAEGVPISPSQAWRICRALDLKPWQVQSWMTSHDPDFWEKAGDVCGLYLNPPDNALVWSVDEKTGIQAKSRINPTRPAIPARGDGDQRRPGIPVRREFEYRRNGTAKLFAALNVHDGTVAGWVTDSARAENFVAFLTDLVARPRPGCSCTASSTTSPLTAPRPSKPSSMTTRTCSCTAPRPTPPGSTRSSCGSRSWNDASSATASSTPSTTSPTASSSSSTPTTVKPNHSAGPTTPAHSRLRDITMTCARSH